MVSLTKTPRKSTNWIEYFMEHPDFLVCDKYERSYIHLKSVENRDFPESEPKIVCQIQDFDGNFHLERLRLIAGERNKVRPTCRCGSRFKSQGTNQSLRCPSCGLEHENLWEAEMSSTDWQEPPPSYRRHMAKPLSRMGKSEV